LSKSKKIEVAGTIAWVQELHLGIDKIRVAFSLWLSEHMQVQTNYSMSVLRNCLTKSAVLNRDTMVKI